MLDIKQLRPADIGRWVTYHAQHGATESGRIKSWNEFYIFVVYKCDNNWGNFRNYTGAATRPEHLTFQGDN